jgi:pilus assembly protein CpaC
LWQSRSLAQIDVDNSAARVLPRGGVAFTTLCNPMIIAIKSESWHYDLQKGSLTPGRRDHRGRITMTFRRFIAAGLMGATLVFGALPTASVADTLRVMRGETASILTVPMNRAVVVESDTVFAELSVANPGIADIATLSDRTIYVLGKSPGRTTLTLLGPDGRLITNVEVQVVPDIAEFKERLQQIMPNESIEVRTANDGIVLSGTVSSITRLDRALSLAQRYAPDRVSNLMTVGGTQQVMLKVRFAEMQRSVAKNLNASLGISTGNATNGILTGGGAFGSVAGLGQIGNAAASSGLDNRLGTFNVSLGNSAVQVNILLEALEQRGVVRTLAEPNLTALSGQEASFLAGGEYPVPVSDGQGGVSIDYKPFGIELTFIPRVLDDGIINLELKASVSGVDSAISVSDAGGIAVNGFSRRETSTTVQMRDGQSFAIAGLLQDDFTNLQGQVPWLGDIPILGALFRSASYSRDQSELVIMITPHLVTPTTSEAIALPTDRIRIPNERDFFLFGRLTDQPQSGPVGEVARQDFEAPYGYVLE